MKPNGTGKFTEHRKRFIAWDGEGITIPGRQGRQSYVLFGCSTGEHVIRDEHIPSWELFDFMIDVKVRNPDAHHIGFAFNYDSNMLVQSLPEKLLRLLHVNGRVTVQFNGTRYHIQYRPGKWFQVTRIKGAERDTIKIEDVFSFFASSFVKAYEKLVGPAPEIVTEGKKNRKTFTIDQLQLVEQYWSVEIRMLEELADSLRDNLYSAGLDIQAWYGPGSLASLVLRRHRIKASMARTPEAVSDAARYAYAGGRFELFRLGRHWESPIYAVDINSAYPNAIADLPNLFGGTWRHLTAGTRPNTPNEFGMFRIRIHPRTSATIYTDPGPLFHRDKMGCISFPWKLEGWYWGPEAWNIKDHPDVEFLEAWIFDPVDSSKPFAWVRDTYELRREWKSQGNPSELALKLCLNSLYGKMAQRIGWNKEKNAAPVWHQLEWAGWVTSRARAMLYALMRNLKPDSLISVETDAVYTTDPNVAKYIAVGTGLGEWSLDVYDEVIYLQSGFAWLRKGRDWSCKRRGIDEDTFSLGDCLEYIKTLKANGHACQRGRCTCKGWHAYEGETTRFITMGSALASSVPTKFRHCVWSTQPKAISPGVVGKRFHIPGQCKACRGGMSAYDGMHDLAIRSRAMGERFSYPHDIPWLGNEPAEWRNEPDMYLANDMSLDWEMV